MNEPEPLTFFTDECLGRLVPNALKRAGIPVELYLDWFEPGVPDTEWIPVVSERGWLILTIDAMISRRIAEQAAIAQANGRVFVFASSKVNSVAISTAMVQAYSTMVAIATETEAPFIAKIYKSGEARLWRDRHGLWEVINKYAKPEDA